MKRIILLLLLTTGLASGQLIEEIPQDSDGHVYLMEVIQKDSVTKLDFYSRSKNFFAESFKSAKDVIQLDDKDNTTVIGKGLSGIYIKSGFIQVPINMHYTIKIQSKDDRYKYEISNVYYTSSEGYQISAESWLSKENYFKKNGKARSVNEEYKNKTLAVLENIKSNIKRNMNKPVNDSSEKW